MSNNSTPIASGESVYFDLQKTTIQNSPGYPALPPVEIPTKQVRQKAYLGNQSAAEACSCVIFIKNYIGYTGSIGAARNWPVNSSLPSVGAVVITYESSVGHVAYITAIEGEYLILSEANYVTCRITHGRKLHINSNLIKGYWIP